MIVSWIIILTDLVDQSILEGRIYERFRLEKKFYNQLRLEAIRYSHFHNATHLMPEFKFDEGSFLKFRINGVTIEFVSGDETDYYITQFIKKLQYGMGQNTT